MSKMLLKDQLFNRQKIERIANEISRVHAPFQSKIFVEATLEKFPVLELKQRIAWIRTVLYQYLPKDYCKAVQVLIRSLPPEADPTRSDNDFGDFIYAPYSDFVAHYGCKKEVLTFSLESLKTFTTRFSSEDAIRYFINTFPAETLATLTEWATDSHYHVRRLASEGTRPKLPWAQKICLSAEEPMPILDTLFADPTRFVTRSVANHLNDISKKHPDLVIDALRRWEAMDKQSKKELDFIKRHALRTLIKQGDTEALALLGASDAPVILSNFVLHESEVRIGESLHFSCVIQADSDMQVHVDYTVYFQNKQGNMASKKIYKGKKISLKSGVSIRWEKKHPLRGDMTTRKLYPGPHAIALHINGQQKAYGVFFLANNHFPEGGAWGRQSPENNFLLAKGEQEK